MRWTYAALAFAVAYGGLRSSWALGGRWGYSACAPADPHTSAELATGCHADRLTTLPFWHGWGAVVLCALLVGVTTVAVLRRGWLPAAAAWLASAALVALSFPGHLLFEIPVALTGEPADWRQLTHRAVQLGGGLLVGAAATAVTPGRHDHPGERTVRTAPRWVRRATYAACAIPVLGYSAPHLLWAFGVPFGIGRATLRQVLTDLSPGIVALLCAGPAVGGLLTLGLGMRWGQQVPHRVPYLGGRIVPRPVALVPAAVVALALDVYGVLGLVLIGGALADGTTSWERLSTDWAVVGTELVFLLWGAALSVATAGYALLTRAASRTSGPRSARR